MFREALLKAGLVSADDLIRTQSEKKNQEKFEANVRMDADRFSKAMTKIPKHLANEMMVWMEGNRIIPVDVLEKWSYLNNDKVTVEWSRWLSAAREINA